MNKPMSSKWYMALFLGAGLSCSEVTKNDAIVEVNSMFPEASVSCADTPWCSFTSSEKKWPSEKLNGLEVPISDLFFIVSIPRKYSKITVLWGPLPHYTIHFDKYLISISLEDVPNISQITGNNGNYSHDKLFDIIFTQIPNKPEPMNRIDRLLWRFAFRSKASQYKSATKGIIYRKDKWTAYTVNIQEISYTRKTIITHKDIPNRFLQILDDGAPKVVIERILSSIILE